MCPAARSSGILLSLVLLSATGALAQDRCSGTLCDFYYGTSGSAAQRTANPPTASQQPETPLTVPSGGILGFLSRGGSSGQPPAPGTAAPQPLVGVGGGGVAAMARGEPAERCTGTFCDLYYGGPPPERPSDQTVTGDQQATPNPTPEAAADETPAPSRHRRATRDETPRCAASAEDPWKCYR